MKTNRQELATPTSATIAEFENRFNDIDTTLDAIRSSIKEEEEEGEKKKKQDGDEHDGDDDDEGHEIDATTATNSEDYSLINVTKLQASLAEQSAAKMEEIVRTLGRQKEERDDEDNLSTISRSSSCENEKETTTTAKAAATRQQQEDGEARQQQQHPNNSTSRNSNRWWWRIIYAFFVVVPTLLSAFLAWKLHVSTKSSDNDNRAQSNNIALLLNSEHQPRPALYRRETVAVQQCRYDANGRRYCKRDERTRTSSGGGGGDGTGYGQETVRQQQYCRYANGHRYCESYEQRQQQQQQQQQQSTQRSINGADGAATAASSSGDGANTIPSGRRWGNYNYYQQALNN